MLLIRLFYIVSFKFRLPKLKFNAMVFTKESLINVYMMPFLTTREVKLQMLQYKIIHNILPTRFSLFRTRLPDSDICRICQTMPETSTHVLQCDIYSPCFGTLSTIGGLQKLFIPLSSINAMLYIWYNNTQSKDLLNYFILVAKCFISCCFQHNAIAIFDSFPPFLRNKIDTLKQNALKINS